MRKRLLFESQNEEKTLGRDIRKTRLGGEEKQNRLS